jgi:hypothetical protein
MSNLVTFKVKRYNERQVRMIESAGYRFVVSMFKNDTVILFFRKV